MAAECVPVPVTDSPRAHETGDEADCWCSPKVEPVKRDDGSVGWLVTHRREAVSDSPAETRVGVICANGRVHVDRVPLIGTESPSVSDDWRDAWDAADFMDEDRPENLWKACGPHTVTEVEYEDDRWVVARV